MTDFKLYVMPISGGGFPVQLAEVSLLYDAYKINNPMFTGEKDYTPDLVYGASGGNVAAYVSMGGDWYYQGILRMVENINSKMFIKSWWPDDLDFMPTWVLSIFTGTVFRAGYGPEQLLTQAFKNPYRIQSTEILTLTFNQTRYVPQLFSNRSSENSHIPELSTIDKELYDLPAIKYLNGDIDELSRVCMASAAIPIITQPQVIQDNRFDDGGLSAASPLSLLLEETVGVISDKKLHLIYFASYDMDEEDKSKFKKYGNGARATLSCMVHSRTLQDRANAVQLLEKVSGHSASRQVYRDASTELLAEKLAEYSDSHYVIVMYPRKSPDISITEFKSESVIELINEIRESFNFDLWIPN